jgi:hypothetical protein
MGLADQEKGFPMRSSDDAVAVQSKQPRLEVERVKEVKRVGFGKVAGRNRWMVPAKVHDAINSADGIAVPLRPPTAQWMAHGLVRWVLKKETVNQLTKV